MTLEEEVKMYLIEYYEAKRSFSYHAVKAGQKTGTHGFSLKGAVIDVPFSPDTTAVLIELLFYMEKTEVWKEYV